MTTIHDPQPGPFSSPLANENRLVGQSQAIRRIDDDIDCAARSAAKVLITGETGVGKEVVARLIHQRSARKSGPLVTVNCAGLPDSLLESELFGHVRGSFTGAYRDKPGLLEMAPHGTVFLDEVGEMSTRMQVVLLRFLETGEIQRVGADRPHARLDVRLVTATNRDLQAQIAAGAFREDLYFRLNVIRLSIPPLRERREDIPLIVDHYLDVYSRQHRVGRSTLSPPVLDFLVNYGWPGNVRELKNVVERMVVRSGGETVRLSDLPGELMPRARVTAAPQPAGAAAVRQCRAQLMIDLMLLRGESFWSAVYPMFISRDLTRDDLRKIIHIGLQKTNGSYRSLTQLFNMPEENYKRFLSFLRKHECHLPFQNFRAGSGRAMPTAGTKATSSGDGAA